MRIEFHGAVRTVTGSQHLLHVIGHKILLDCGLFQGSRKRSYERNQKLPYDAAEVDVLILSHAHIDHSGNIPNLVKNGFEGDIICTYATRDLCSIMLRDSAKIQGYDMEYLNKKRRRKGLDLLQPFYTVEDVVQSLKHFIGIGYERPYQVMPGISLTFYDAGHILGSAIVALDIDDQEVFDFLADDVHSDPFGFDMMSYTRSTRQSNELNFLREPDASMTLADGLRGQGYPDVHVPELGQSFTV
jgi:metallo-beta-lactamase family protein